MSITNLLNIAINANADKLAQEAATQAQREATHRDLFAATLSQADWLALGIDPAQALYEVPYGRLTLPTILLPLSTFDLTIPLTIYGYSITGHDWQSYIATRLDGGEHIRPLGKRATSVELGNILFGFARLHAQALDLAVKLAKADIERQAQNINPDHLTALRSTWPTIPNITPAHLEELEAQAQIAAAQILVNQAIAAERHEQRLAEAARLIALAQQHTAALAAYDSAARVWVEHWTAELWQPWAYWRIRYVPIYPVAIPEGDDPDNFIQTVMALNTPSIVRSFNYTVIEVAGFGDLQDRVIGAFLDATKIECPAVPDPSVRLLYHRTLRAGDYYLNLPPTVERNPPPFTHPAPADWADVVAAANIDLRLIFDGSIYRYRGNLPDPTDLAQRTPAEICAGNYNTTISF